MRSARSGACRCSPRLPCCRWRLGSRRTPPSSRCWTRWCCGSCRWCTRVSSSRSVREGRRAMAAASGTEASSRTRCTAISGITIVCLAPCSAASPRHCTSRTGGRSEQVNGELVSGSFFPTLGITPAAGRLFTDADDRAAGARPVAVLGFNYWKARFNGDRSVLGRTMTVNGHPLEIVGVVHSRFQGLDIGSPVSLYMPITMQPQMGPAWLQLDGRRFRWVQVFARIRDVSDAGACPDGNPAAVPVAARAGSERRGVRDGIGRHEAAIPRRPAERHRCRRAVTRGCATRSPSRC